MPVTPLSTATPAPPDAALRESAPATTPATTPAPRRVPALDGLRAIAVVAVIAFHAFPSLAPGGFAGVDVFFVLSGFLITGGLLQRRPGQGGIWRFWVRRARRLLPALALLVVVVGSLVRLTGGDAGVGFGGQLVAAALFFTNWHLIAAGNSYFTETSPPVLQHLWSLAVEEQFYLVWPVLLTAICRLGGRLRTRLALVTGLGALSLASMITLAATGHIGRAYYGSDSHSFGLLAGAALALVYAARPALPVSSVRIASAGVAGLLALLLAFRVLDGDTTATYVLGLPAVVGITLLLVQLSLHDNGLLDRTLGVLPLRAIGVRSYGLYLWHWPILELLRNAFPTMSLQHTTTTGVLAVAATAVVASASYAFVEQPIQRLGLRGWLATIKRWALGAGGVRVVTVTGAAAATALAVVLTGIAAAHSPQVGVEQSQIEAGEKAIQQAGYATAPAPAPQPKRGATAPAPIGRNITAIGDSVMLASAPALLHRFPGIAIDAVVSRQPTTAPGILAALARRHQLRPIVMVGLGTNGYLGSGTLAAIRQIIGPTRELVLVNVFVPREWQSADNIQLAQYVAHDPHSALVDWRSAIAGHVGLLSPDHIHPGAAGGTLYAQTVASTLAAYASRHAAAPAPTRKPAATTTKPTTSAKKTATKPVSRPAHRPAAATPAARGSHAGSGSRAGSHPAAAAGQGSGRTRS